jgi:hypothetical protein
MMMRPARIGVVARIDALSLTGKFDTAIILLGSALENEKFAEDKGRRCYQDIANELHSYYRGANQVDPGKQQRRGHA